MIRRFNRRETRDSDDFHMFHVYTADGPAVLQTGRVGGVEGRPRSRGGGVAGRARRRVALRGGPLPAYRVEGVVRGVRGIVAQGRSTHAVDRGPVPLP